MRIGILLRALNSSLIVQDDMVYARRGGHVA